MSLHDQHRTSDPADPDSRPDLHSETDKHIDAGDRIPRWAYMTLVASRVVTSPGFILPYTLMAAAVIVYTDGLFLRVCGLAGPAAGTVLFVTMDMVSRMHRDGVLQTYVSCLLATTRVGWCFRRRYLNV